ncbi:MAG: TIGR00303 family protein [Haloarculaceae archaeon]
MRLLVTAGSTHTAAIDGLSAAGASTALLAHTPAADLEILQHGEPTAAPVVPVSPTGCPTPAVVTRAVVEFGALDPVAVDAGTARSPAVETVDLGDAPGADIREPVAVPEAADRFDRARAHGRSLPDDAVLVGETIPGGTTTAMAVLRALGEREAVSSSLPANPLSLKDEVVTEALTRSDIAPGGAAGEPHRAVRAVGDPVLPAVAGLTVGALENGASVTLAGGTQLAAAAALVRHAGVEDSLTLATTSFVAADETARIEALAGDLDLDLIVTDPGFETSAHPALAAYVAGEAKEGVGMGGALAVADRRGIAGATLRERVGTIADRLDADREATQ